MSVRVEREGPVTTVIIDRPDVRNAVEPATAAALREAFDGFEADEDASVAVLTGAGGHFCAGFDLNAVAAGAVAYDPEGEGPMGPTRRLLSKPVLAAVDERHAPAPAEDAEHRRFAGDAQVAQERQLEPARHGIAFNGRDRRLGEDHPRRTHGAVPMR